MKIKEIALVGILTAIIFLIDQVLSFVPFLQLSMLFIILFSRKLRTLKTSIIIIVYVTLDYLIIGFNVLFVIFTILGWMFVPLLSNSVFKQTKSVFFIGLQGILFSFLYSWIFIVPSCLIGEIDVFEYLKLDIIFEISLALSSFLTIIFLYKPLEKVLDRFLINTN